MDIYKNLYFKLFNKLTDLSEEIKKIQQEAEEEYISYETKQKVTPISCKNIQCFFKESEKTKNK